MKILVAPLFALSLISAPAFASAPNSVATGFINKTVEHSGGCRKDSPAGMCCHAGKAPYHCH